MNFINLVLRKIQNQIIKLFVCKDIEGIISVQNQWFFAKRH